MRLCPASLETYADCLAYNLHKAGPGVLIFVLTVVGGTILVAGLVQLLRD